MIHSRGEGHVLAEHCQPTAKPLRGLAIATEAGSHVLCHVLCGAPLADELSCGQPAKAIHREYNKHILPRVLTVVPTLCEAAAYTYI